MASTNLQFQEFSLNMGEGNAKSSNEEYQPSGMIGDRSDYFSGGSKRADGSDGTPKKSFFSFDFYQQYFDVDTDQVVTRILNSMVPRFGTNFITDYIQPIPDLYGPFWICVTLVFTTAICGNLAKYIETSGDVKNFHYESDFGLVTGASTLIACYVILVPFALYTLLWYRKSEMQYSFLEILSAYAYSLSIFVPVSVLWVVHIQWFRWLLIVISVFLSGAVLIGAIWPALKNDRSRLVSVATIVGVLLAHCLLAIAFKEFYFDASHPVGTPSDRLPVPGGLPVLPNAPEEAGKEGVGDRAKEALPAKDGDKESKVAGADANPKSKAQNGTESVKRGEENKEKSNDESRKATSTVKSA